MAQIIKTNGDVLDVEPKSGKDFQLDELQSFVGGYIQIVPLKNGQLMVINEEGKINALAINLQATGVFGDTYGDCDIIVGDVLICEENQIK